MWRDLVMRNKIAVAFALGALYVGAYALLLVVLDAQDEENERIAALRWENGRLIARLATQAPAHPAEPGGGPS